MALEDFRRYFNRVQICKVNDDHVYSSIKLDHSAENWSVLICHLEEDSNEVFINISQTDKRFFPEGSDYDYSNCKFIFCKRDAEDNLTFVGAKSGKGREVHLRMENLEAGEYAVYV